MRPSLAEQLAQLYPRTAEERLAQVHWLLKEARCQSKKRRKRAKEQLMTKYGIDLTNNQQRLKFERTLLERGKED
jgi:hypothetical protein